MSLNNTRSTHASTPPPPTTLLQRNICWARCASRSPARVVAINALHGAMARGVTRRHRRPLPHMPDRTPRPHSPHHLPHTLPTHTTQRALNYTPTYTTHRYHTLHLLPTTPPTPPHLPLPLACRLGDARAQHGRAPLRSTAQCGPHCLSPHVVTGCYHLGHYLDACLFMVTFGNLWWLPGYAYGCDLPFSTALDEYGGELGNTMP